jgi:hypothetical protein
MAQQQTREREATFIRRATSSSERQQWLELAVEALRARFAAVGYVIPMEIRFAIGWPKRATTCGAVGECWATSASSDRHAELFVSPELTEGARILDVLAHELVHATVGTGVGHKKPFRDCALKIGLVGPMRATTAGTEFQAWAEALMQRIGPYPAGYLIDVKKQSTRLLKCECSRCGYTVRITRKWLTIAGPPICPTDHIRLTLAAAPATSNAELITEFERAYEQQQMSGDVPGPSSRLKALNDEITRRERCGQLTEADWKISRH